ncbi:ribonuclease P protein component [Sediminibacterium soli]|uniref:ribonuclease P protein component n=1 Tax=Sediminibacterium soli TaxID=2698829 RepID=UPI0013795FBC|nr:ribonuclease P protein component [Sediminibacterium soli]NCI47788.1 ribonuclease P protein component [Sediminibacterium soli]
MAYTYGKKEKLKSRKLIEALFAKGRSFSAFPLKVFFSIQPAESEVVLQAGVGVSARNFRKATDRNRIKRLLREAYRLQKTELQAVGESQQKSLALFFLYTGKEMPEANVIQDKMRSALNKLAEQINR